MNFQEIHKRFQENETKIDRYFEAEFKKTPPLLYLSTDLRHSGFKISAVDTNLFPAGFNNLCNSFTHLATEGFRLFFDQQYPQAKIRSVNLPSTAVVLCWPGLAQMCHVNV